MRRPLQSETTAKIIEELLDMATLCDDLATSTFHPKAGETFSPQDQAHAAILAKVTGAFWSIRGAVLREAAHRLDRNKEQA